NAVTESGSNEFHGKMWTYLTPGVFEGPREKVITQAQTIHLDPELVFTTEYGAAISGPILKDKLWFSTGVLFDTTRYRIKRRLERIKPSALDAHNQVILDPETHVVPTEPIPGAERDYFASEKQIQFIGKLTYLFNQNHQVSVSLDGTPTWSGGDGYWGIDPQ